MYFSGINTLLLEYIIYVMDHIAVSAKIIISGFVSGVFFKVFSHPSLVNATIIPGGAEDIAAL